MIYEVLITKLIYGGDGLGRLPDGRAVFVPFVIPGEKVNVEIVDDRPRYARARVAEILSPSPDRLQPRCRHFGVCGGCHYQHMTYRAQVAAKMEILVDQLARIGKLASIPIQNIIPSSDEWHYRNYIQFHISSQGELGYARSQSDEIEVVQECLLPEYPLDEIWPLLRIEPGTGIQRIGLRRGIEEEVQIILESSSDKIPEFAADELEASVVHTFENSHIVLAGSVYTWQNIHGRHFRISPGSFFQVNTALAGKMVDMIMSEIPDMDGLKVLEFYCGVGLFSAILAERSEKLVAVESSASACDDFVYNLDNFNNVDLYEASAENVIGSINFSPDIVVVDPPRSGLLPEVLQGVVEKSPQKIIYISCDPSTLARDARYLGRGGYGLVKVIPLDMFPQTYHIESISIWIKNH